MRRVVLVLGALVIGTLAATPSALAEREHRTVMVDCATHDLQSAINNADSGATLHVRGTCVGNFTINKDLRIIGHRGATLRGDGGTVVTIATGAHVRISDVTITGGIGNRFQTPQMSTFKVGGIDNAGWLTLAGSTSVTGNSTYYGVSGINNNNTLTMNDRSSVSDNGNVAFGYGGVANFGTFIMNDRASVTRNSSPGLGGTGGGVSNTGTMNMNDRSSVDDNSARQLGGGIDNSGTLSLRDRASINHNTANTGGGVRNTGTIVLKDRSSIRDNTAGSSGGISNTGGGTVVGWSTRVFDNTPDQCNGC